MAHEQPSEQMLDVFRAAALSVTKLYKSSITAQAKARAEGYQDCLDELLQFLDRENLGLGDGEGWKIRSWANEHLDARDGLPPFVESDDDAEKPDPNIHRSTSAPIPQAPIPQPQQQQQQQQQQAPDPSSIPPPNMSMRTDTPIVEEIAVDEPEIIVPTRDTFDFRSSHQYPQDAQNQLNIANLQLSDTRSHDNPSAHPITSLSTPRSGRPIRHLAASGGRGGSRILPNHIGRGPASKRKVRFEEFFDIGNLGPSRDGFGGPPAKRRHM